MFSETGTAGVGTGRGMHLSKIAITLYYACSSFAVFAFQVPTVNTKSRGEFGLDLDQEDVSDP